MHGRGGLAASWAAASRARLDGLLGHAGRGSGWAGLVQLEFSWAGPSRKEPVLVHSIVCVFFIKRSF